MAGREDRVLEGTGGRWHFPLPGGSEGRRAMEAAKVEAPGPSSVSQVCAPTTTIERAAKGVGWMKVIIGAIVAAAGVGFGTAAYLTSFAKAEDVQENVHEHVNSDSPHPAISKDLRDLQERLIRVETVQQQMATTQERMQTGQERINEKLDRLLSAGAAWRLPPVPGPSPGP